MASGNVRTYTIELGFDERGEYVSIPKEAFLVIWRMTGQQPADPFEVTSHLNIFNAADIPAMLSAHDDN
jgi:hypothetical protein